jgi:hypothetical protein
MSQHQRLHDEIELVETNPQRNQTYKPPRGKEVVIDVNMGKNESINEKRTTVIRCCHSCRFDDLVVAMHNIISIIWGCICLGEEGLDIFPISELSIFILMSFSTVISAVILSITLTTLIYILYLVKNPSEAGVVFGCIPVLYSVFLYMSYGAILGLGFDLLSEIGESVTPVVYWFIIYQISMSIFCYLLAIYEIFCDRNNSFSPHLIEIEQETFYINKDEVERYRAEVRKQIAEYQDRLEKKIPFLSQTKTEQIIIQNDQYVPPDISPGKTSPNLVLDMSKSSNTDKQTPVLKLDTSQLKSSESKKTLKLFKK